MDALCRIRNVMVATGGEAPAELYEMPHLTFPWTGGWGGG